MASTGISPWLFVDGKTVVGVMPILGGCIGGIDAQ